MRKQTLTREILATMRKAHGPHVNGIRLSRAYGRRRYFLAIGDGIVWTGHAAMYDATTGELWVKPHGYASTNNAATYDALKPTLDALRVIQREHGEPRDIPAAHPDHVPYMLHTR